MYTFCCMAEDNFALQVILGTISRYSFIREIRIMKKEEYVLCKFYKMVCKSLPMVRPSFHGLLSFFTGPLCWYF